MGLRTDCAVGWSEVASEGQVTGSPELAPPSLQSPVQQVPRGSRAWQCLLPTGLLQ